MVSDTMSRMQTRSTSSKGNEATAAGRSVGGGSTSRCSGGRGRGGASLAANEDDGDDDRITRTYHFGPSKTWGFVGVKVNHPTKRLLLAFLPEPFLKSCGDNTWSYVYKILEMTTECGNNATVFGEDGTAYPRTSRDVPMPGSYVLNMSGERRTPTDRPTGGANLTPAPRQPDHTDVKVSRGPTNRRGKQFGAPDLDAEESTVSNSARSSTNQVSYSLKTILLVPLAFALCLPLLPANK